MFTIHIFRLKTFYSGLQMATFLLCPFLCVCTILVCLMCPQIYSSYKTSQIGLGPTLMASFNLITFLKVPFPNIQSHYEVTDVRALTYEIGGYDSAHNTTTPLLEDFCFLVALRFTVWKMA